MTDRHTRPIHDMGPLQREILSLLWEKGPMTVHEVLVALPDPPHYVTVLTVMRRMMDRGILSGEKLRDGSGPRQFRFTPTLSRSEVQLGVLRDLIPSLFPTSRELFETAVALELVS